MEATLKNTGTPAKWVTKHNKINIRYQRAHKLNNAYIAHDPTMLYTDSALEIDSIVIIKSRAMRMSL